MPQPATTTKSIRVAMYTPFTGCINPKDKTTASKAISDYLRTLNQDDSPQARVDLLFDRLKQAHTTCIAAGEDFTNPDLLHIFLAPEWYFRSSAKIYTAEDREAIIAGLREQSAAQYPNWLIIPGTIFWGEKKGFVGGTFYVYNCAPVIYGGECLLTLYKSFEADAIDSDTQLWGMDESKKKKALDRSGIFGPIKGISFGLEICRDNSEGVLVNDYKSSKPGGMGVDVHILISCSTQFQKLRIATRTGGYSLQCDGNLEKDAWNLKGSANLFPAPNRGQITLEECLELCLKEGGHGVTPPKALTNIKHHIVENPRDERVVLFDAVTLTETPTISGGSSSGTGGASSGGAGSTVQLTAGAVTGSGGAGTSSASPGAGGASSSSN